MAQFENSISKIGLAFAPSLFFLVNFSPAPAEAARRDGQAYTRTDAEYVTQSRDKARLDFIVCLQGVAGASFPGGSIDQALEDAAAACGAWANRVQPNSGEPDVQDLVDSIKECGFQPGDASPDADCDGASAGVSTPQPGLATSNTGVMFSANVVGLAKQEIISIRSAPSINSDKIGALPADARGVEVIGCNNTPSGQWCEIEFDGLHGFIKEAQYLQDASKAQPRNGSSNWWVVVQSEPNPDNGDTGPANARANRKLAACRFEAFSDWSAKWQGFRPGFSVSVLGPYRSKDDAENVRRAASVCIPDANVRRAVYAGE